MAIMNQRQSFAKGNGKFLMEDIPLCLQRINLYR